MPCKLHIEYKVQDVMNASRWRASINKGVYPTYDTVLDGWICAFVVCTNKASWPPHDSLRTFLHDPGLYAPSIKGRQKLLRFSRQALQRHGRVGLGSSVGVISWPFPSPFLALSYCVARLQFLRKVFVLPILKTSQRAVEVLW